MENNAPSKPGIKHLDWAASPASLMMATSISTPTPSNAPSGPQHWAAKTISLPEAMAAVNAGPSSFLSSRPASSTTSNPLHIYATFSPAWSKGTPSTDSMNCCRGTGNQIQHSQISACATTGRLQTARKFIRERNGADEPHQLLGPV